MRKLSPIEKYQRERRKQMLTNVDFYGKEVLEIGIFKTDNLKIASAKKAKALYGAAILDSDLKLVKSQMNGLEIDLAKISKDYLPFPDQCFDLVFSDTFYQHVTDNSLFEKLLKEACRTAEEDLVLIETTEAKAVKSEHLVARKPDEYVKICESQDFKIKKIEYINAEISLNFANFLHSNFKKNNPDSNLSEQIQSLSLPITKILDSFFPANRHLTKMVFERKPQEYF